MRARPDRGRPDRGKFDPLRPSGRYPSRMGSGPRRAGQQTNPSLDAQALERTPGTSAPNTPGAAPVTDQELGFAIEQLARAMRERGVPAQRTIALIDEMIALIEGGENR